MSLTLDRVEIESAGTDPVKLASALLDQLPDPARSVPIDEIAGALDIVEIKRAPLHSLEGCLQFDKLKSYGQIVVNSRSTPARQRYSIGHELGHFLNERHQPTTESGFECTAGDMAGLNINSTHQRQEQEANVFAIEVLTPRRLLPRYLNPYADLEHVLAMADRFEISREAATRRYVALHDECLAAVFSKDDRVKYVVKNDAFPRTSFWSGEALPFKPSPPIGEGSLTTLDGSSADLWLTNPGNIELFTQTLFQANGYAVTLLVVDQPEKEEELLPRFKN